jgi:hypothetical protein
MFRKTEGDPYVHPKKKETAGAVLGSVNGNTSVSSFSGHILPSHRLPRKVVLRMHRMGQEFTCHAHFGDFSDASPGSCEYSYVDL